jgi:hypothetical protein
VTTDKTLYHGKSTSGSSSKLTNVPKILVMLLFFSVINWFLLALVVVEDALVLLLFSHAHRRY